MDHFYDPIEEMFFFTANNSEKLIARKKELFDNVIPSSNSTMATNLYWLGILLEKNYYVELSIKMLSKVKKLILSEPSYLAHWASLLTTQITPTAEIAISGNEHIDFRKKLDQVYNPNRVFAGTKRESKLPLLQDRSASNGDTTIYVCYDNRCNLPVKTIEEALKIMTRK
jgi:uncharacterized protein YyaL (SSP411 family)